jgi:hypothetical protein
VDVFVDGQKILSNVAYGQSSDYLEVPAGTYRVKVTAAGDPSAVLIRQNLTVRPGTFNTAVAVGSVSDLNNLSLLALQDDPTCPPSGRARIRVVHAAADAPTVDIAADGNVILPNVSFRDVSDYLEIPAPDTPNLSILAGGNTVFEMSLPVKAGQNLTVLASGIPGNEQTPLTVIPLVDNAMMCVCAFV